MNRSGASSRAICRAVFWLGPGRETYSSGAKARAFWAVGVGAKAPTP